MTKRWNDDGRLIAYLILGIIGLCFVLSLGGCFRIPVTVHPPMQEGRPIALPTAPTGVAVAPDGTETVFNPEFDRPSPRNYTTAATVTGLVLLLLHQARNMPGLTGLFAGMATAAWNVIAPKKVREEDDAKDQEIARLRAELETKSTKEKHHEQ
jgi:hypothetical protein